MFRSCRPRHAAVTVLCVALGACSVTPSEEQSPPPALSDPSGETSALGQCDAPPHPYSSYCHTTRRGEAGSEETSRYLYFPVENATTAAILDLGGPGNPTFSSFAFDSEVASLNQRGYSVVVLEEDWVTAQVPDNCLDALKNRYRTARDHYPNLPPDEIDSAVIRYCFADSPLVQQPAFRFSELVESVDSQIPESITALAGYSLASVRASYLEETYPDLKVSVANPFPVGAAANDFLQESWERQKVSTTYCGDCSENSFHLDSAIAYGQADTAEDIVRSSSGLWQNDLDDSVSFSIVGYYAEILCPALSEWSFLEESSQANPLSSLHSICSHFPSNEILKLPTNSCLRIAENDPIAPWLPSEQTSTAEIEFVEGDSHQELEYSKECLMR